MPRATSLLINLPLLGHDLERPVQYWVGVTLMVIMGGALVLGLRWVQASTGMKWLVGFMFLCAWGLLIAIVLISGNG
jgi:hypothetical protein